MPKKVYTKKKMTSKRPKRTKERLAAGVVKTPYGSKKVKVKRTTKKK